jgi:GT2 family glycosyltransferase
MNQPANDLGDFASSPLVYVVMLNYNGPQDALECLASLTKLTYPNKHILVVDNGSTDDSIQIISQHYPEVEILAIAPNRGFGGGMNAGMQHALEAGADLVFTTSNDTWIAPHSLEALVQYLEPGVGALAPLIYYASLPQTIWSGGGKTSRWNLEKRDRLQNRLEPPGLPAFIEQDFVTCAVLFTRQALEEAGMFDEGFYIYYEDSDHCFRLRRAGFRIRMVPAAKLWHKVAASSGGSNSPGERYWMARSSLRFFRKHAKRWQIPIVVVWRTLSALRTTLRLLWRRKPEALKAYWRGLRDGLGDLRKPI